MTAGLLSLGAGVVIGLLYALLKVRSPAPPAIALVGLLGMLIGGWLTSAALDAYAAHDATQATSLYTRTG